MEMLKERKEWLMAESLKASRPKDERTNCRNSAAEVDYLLWEAPKYLPGKSAVDKPFVVTDENKYTIMGLEAELDILVDQILAAKDLDRLKETTLLNFPEKKESANNAQPEETPEPKCGCNELQGCGGGLSCGSVKSEPKKQTFSKFMDEYYHSFSSDSKFLIDKLSEYLEGKC